MYSCSDIIKIKSRLFHKIHYHYRTVDSMVFLAAEAAVG